MAAPIETGVWGDARQHIDEYYTRVRDLFHCLDAEYLPKLARDYGLDALRQGFPDEFKNLDELRDHLLLYKYLLDDLRQNQLRVKGKFQRKIVNRDHSRFGAELDGLGL